jgi:hypothetical protein
MPVSPQANTDGVVTFLVKCNGTPMAETVSCYSIEVRRAVGQVPSARIELGDGDMPDGLWELADGTQYVPGTEIEIEAGYNSQHTTIFKGVVVRMKCRVGANNASRLILDCADKAVALTLLRRNAVYIDQTDSAVMQTLTTGSDASIEVSSTSVTHKELVQFDSTNWDFLLARAEYCGLLVIVKDGVIKVKAPDVSAAPALQVTWGADLMAFSADMDARPSASRCRRCLGTLPTKRWCWAAARRRKRSMRKATSPVPRWRLPWGAPPCVCKAAPCCRKPSWRSGARRSSSRPALPGCVAP